MQNTDGGLLLSNGITSNGVHNESSSKESKKIILVNKGTFIEDIKENSEDKDIEPNVQVSLEKVHYGFVQYGNPHWHDPNSITVKYKDGVNEDVIIEIPGERRDGFLLAYVLNYAILPRGRSEKMWTENRTMSLTGSTSGSFKKLPLLNFAPFPWREAQFILQTRSIDNHKVSFPGRLKTVYYGFTKSPKEEFKVNKNVKWQNAIGIFEAEGILKVDHKHNGGYKGMTVLQDIWVRVPDGLNLVWKLGYEKWEGSVQEPSNFRGYDETDTFFYEEVAKEKEIEKDKEKSSPHSASNNLTKSRSSPRLEANILEKHL